MRTFYSKTIVYRYLHQLEKINIRSRPERHCLLKSPPNADYEEKQIYYNYADRGNQWINNEDTGLLVVKKDTLR